MSKKILGAYIGNLSDVPDLQNLLDRFGGKGEGRGNVVMVRLSDDALANVDQLVEATLFSSRSEATAYLVGAGIESQKQLFDRLSTHTKEIRKLKEQLRKVAFEALQPKRPVKKIKITGRLRSRLGMRRTVTEPRP